MKKSVVACWLLVTGVVMAMDVRADELPADVREVIVERDGVSGLAKISCNLLRVRSYTGCSDVCMFSGLDV